MFLPTHNLRTIDPLIIILVPKGMLPCERRRKEEEEEEGKKTTRLAKVVSIVSDISYKNTPSEHA